MAGSRASRCGWGGGGTVPGGWGWTEGGTLTGAARLPAPRRALVGSVLALPFQTTEPSLSACVSLEAGGPSEGVADAGTPCSVCTRVRMREPR